MTSSLNLHDQIELAERRVRLGRLRLKIDLLGIRTAAREFASNPIGLGAVFAATSIVGALVGRKKRYSARRRIT